MAHLESDGLSDIQRKFLISMAEKFIWWKSPDQALRYPQKVLAQVLNIGDIESVRETLRLFGKEVLIEVIQSAEAGQFREISWNYWNLALGLDDDGRVPEPPKR